MKTSFAVVCTLVALLSAPGAKCESISSSLRTVINLGDTPWKFTKIVPPAPDNLARDKPVSQKTEANAQTYELDLGQAYELDRVRFSFSETEIVTVKYELSTSLTGQDDWTVVQQAEATPMIVYTQEVSEIGATVGFVQKPVSAYVDRQIFGRTRFLRLLIRKTKDQPTPAQVAIEVFGRREAVVLDADFHKPEFKDNSWETVGVPHCFNDQDTYLNANDALMWHGTVWYRKHLKLPRELRGQRLLLEFQGVNVGAAVYVNGVFKPGNTAQAQPGQVTHVGGFLPFAIDVTDDVKFGVDNVIAVRVSNAENSFFTWPGFGVFEKFGMGWGGIVCPVQLHALGLIHIPLNAYSPTNRWGTYIATLSTSDEKAVVHVQTQIANTTGKDADVTLTTRFVDAAGNTVLALEKKNPVPAGSCALFEQEGDVAQSTLWYPNNSPHGKPYLYRVVFEVRVGGKLMDRVENKTGLRTITWDADYCYINGKRHLLVGFGHRNCYPGLGSAVPDSLQWQDVRLITECGGNALRVGHVPPPRTTVEACDTLGVLLIMDSGDNEWSLAGPVAAAYKREYDRDMVIAYRSSPSVAIWEANNGLAKKGEIYGPDNTKSVVDQWDALKPRIVLNRDNYPAKYWKPEDRIVVGYTNRYKKVEGSPSLNTEVYGARWGGEISWNAARFDYENEKTLAMWYIEDYLKNILDQRACGWIDWMLAETQGEGYTIHLNGMRKQKSLGSSAMDGNRFPKLKYNIYKAALWIPFETRPGVALQSNWNLSGVQDVDAWSNCASVELFLNGVSKGVQTPDPRSKRCTWKGIAWEAGTLRAAGRDAQGKERCSDQRVTAGAPKKIILSVEPQAMRGDGSRFSLYANGVDAAIVTAKIVDKDDNLCPFADNAIRFTVSGPGQYKGSYNFYITPGKPLSYHAPGDTELQAEGGLMRVAIRTTFATGTIKVVAASSELESAEVRLHAIAN